MYGNNDKGMFDSFPSAYSWFLKIYLSSDKIIIKEFSTYQEAYDYAQDFCVDWEIYKSLLLHKHCLWL